VCQLLGILVRQVYNSGLDRLVVNAEGRPGRDDDEPKRQAGKHDPDGCFGLHEPETP